MWRAPRVTLILIDILKLLCAQKVDMCKANQDGTARQPTLQQHVGILKAFNYLHEKGVSVKHPGSIYD